MRLSSFCARGQDRFGIAIDGGLIDISTRMNDYKTLLELITTEKTIDCLRQFEGEEPDFHENEVEFLPPITSPSKVICVGLNYADHRLESGRDETKYPTIFLRVADSQVGHKRPILKPLVSDQLDYEGEIAVFISKKGRHIDEANAEDHILGYSPFNDASIRDWQFHTHQFSPGKNFRQTGGVGPYIVTADEIDNWQDLELETRLNGDVVQSAKASDMIFSIPALISYCSKWADLNPGDIIVTGTPAGVGLKRTPPLFMKAGDQVDVSVKGVGVLSNPIENEVHD